MNFKKGDIFTSGDRVYEVVSTDSKILMYKPFNEMNALKRSISLTEVDILVHKGIWKLI